MIKRRKGSGSSAVLLVVEYPLDDSWFAWLAGSIARKRKHTRRGRRVGKAWLKDRRCLTVSTVLKWTSILVIEILDSSDNFRDIKKYDDLELVVAMRG